MNKLITSLTLLLVALAWTGNAAAYVGATKFIASVSLPERGEFQPSASLVPLNYEESGTKLVARFLQQMPEPTFSTERILEERPGPSLATKAVVLFQK